MMVMMVMMVMKTVVVCVFVTLGVLAPALGGEHSLFYTYTALSKPLHLPGIYEFTALGMLDDRELDYYNSETQVKIPKQNWMREKMGQDYWDKGTQSRKSKEQWFKVNVDILMDRMRHNKTDLHVLQWRHGCVVKGEDDNRSFVRGIDEYSYDGSEFLSFDEENSRWIAPVPAAEPTKKKWDEVPILNTYTKSYLEKECVDWLNKFMGYGQVELKRHLSQSPPKVHLLTTKSVSSSKRLMLTCLATGFYPPDVQMQLRKSRTSLPENLVTSSGVRPNGDGTYQLRKSVEILKNELLLYDCFVNHSALDDPIIILAKDWKDIQSSSRGIIGVLVSLLLLLLVVAGVIYILYSKGIISFRNTATNALRPENGNVAYSPAPVADAEVNGQANGHMGGHTDGHTDGHMGGHTNGQANGHMGGHTDGHMDGQTDGHTNGHAKGQTDGL